MTLSNSKVLLPNFNYLWYWLTELFDLALHMNESIWWLRSLFNENLKWAQCCFFQDSFSRMLYTSDTSSFTVLAWTSLWLCCASVALALLWPTDLWLLVKPDDSVVSAHTPSLKARPRCLPLTSWHLLGWPTRRLRTSLTPQGIFNSLPHLSKQAALFTFPGPDSDRLPLSF